MNTQAADSKIHSPSELWARTWGSEPEGAPWQLAATRCVMCGGAIEKGDLCTSQLHTVFTPTFNFKLDAKYEGDAVCGWCPAVMNKLWMQKFSKAFAVEGVGIFKMAKNSEIASFILRPPTGRYVAIFNTRQQAQMVWRTPVCTGNPRALQVRLDDELFIVDRQKVFEGVRAWQKASAILAALGIPKVGPFLLSYDMSSTAVSLPRGRNAQVVEKSGPEGAAAIAQLRRLTMGEWWALSACREVDLDDPDAWPVWQRVSPADVAAAAKEPDTEE